MEVGAMGIGRKGKLYRLIGVALFCRILLNNQSDFVLLCIIINAITSLANLSEFLDDLTAYRVMGISPIMAVTPFARYSGLWELPWIVEIPISHYGG